MNTEVDSVAREYASDAVIDGCDDTVDHMATCGQCWTLVTDAVEAAFIAGAEWRGCDRLASDTTAQLIHDIRDAAAQLVGIYDPTDEQHDFLLGTYPRYVAVKVGRVQMGHLRESLRPSSPEDADAANLFGLAIITVDADDHLSFMEVQTENL